MIALIAFLAATLFAAGVITGITGVVSVAIHREDRHTLKPKATGKIVRTARWLTGLQVGPPCPGGAHGETTLA
jgi:hypothetical protein